MYINLDILKTSSGSFVIVNKDTSNHLLIAQDIYTQIFSKVENNPDILVIDLDKIDKLSIGISDIKDELHKFNYKPFENKYKVLSIFQASKLTKDAQNSMLKIIEEPPINSYIFLYVTSINSLLKTVLSRCEVVYLQNEKVKELDSGNILNSNLDEKYLIIKNLYSIKEPKKRREEVEIFFNNLISEVNNSQYGNKKRYEYLDFILNAHEEFKSEVNLRLVLENLIIRLS